MKLIDVSTNKYPNTFVKVSDCDFDWLNQYKWYLSGKNKLIYCYRQKMINGNIETFSMHREIMKKHGFNLENLFVDHINHNCLDNRLENLRKVNNSQNQMNRLKSEKNNKSGYKGVTSYRNGKWRASTKLNGKNIHIGYFFTKEEAVLAYNKIVKNIFGEFAFLNKIGGIYGNL